MNELPEQSPDVEERSVSRWVQVPCGIALGGVVLLCMAGSLMMILLPNEKAPVLAPIFGVLAVLICLWALAKCIQLVTGRKVRGGLIGPFGLRVLAWFFLLLPIGGLFSGYFITHTVQALVQTVASVSIFLGLRSLAARRENR